jgi:uncharacterized protein DUF4238
VSIPRKHHYIPVFYLKQWTGADGRLCEYKNFGSRILTRRTFPAGTGYEKDLYRVERLPDALAQAVESKFMQMVDTEANYALEKIVSGSTTPWDAGMRSAWTRFILSPRFRNPEAVHVIKRQMQDVWKAGVDNLRANYDKLRRPTDPPTFEEFMARAEPEAPHKAALMLLQQIIDNQRVGPLSSTCSGAVCLWPLPASPYLLLTGRWTCLTDWPRKTRISRCQLVPRCSLCRAMMLHGPTCREPNLVVKHVNLAVVSQARKFVWGVNHGHLPFVQKRMSTVPDKPIITDEQKQQAINAAAGR